MLYLLRGWDTTKIRSPAIRDIQQAILEIGDAYEFDAAFWVYDDDSNSLNFETGNELRIAALFNDEFNANYSFVAEGWKK
jgi:hypothetical protein